MRLAALEGGAQPLRNLARRYLEFRGRDDFRAAREARHHRQIAAVPSHGFNQEGPIVRGPGRTQVIDRPKRDVDGGVAADGDICPEQIVVDGRCDADHVDPKLAQHVRARLGPVAADHHDTVDASLGEVAQRLRAAALLAELRGSGAAEKRAADLNDAANVARTERPELTLDQALPTLTDAVNCHALVDRAACDGTYGRIHSGGIATTCQDRDVLHGTRGYHRVGRRGRENAASGFGIIASAASNSGSTSVGLIAT